MSAIDITGPIAASAAVNASTTSACVRSRAPRGHHRLQRLAIAPYVPANVANRGSSPTPSSFNTRARNRIARRRHADPRAVAALVRAARHGVRQPGTEPLLHLPGQLVQRDQRAHQLEQALQQADVDDLADAAAQRDHRGERCHDAR